eukprot:2404756-Pyramimonas_sp.AAC.1
MAALLISWPLRAASAAPPVACTEVSPPASWCGPMANHMTTISGEALPASDTQTPVFNTTDMVLRGRRDRRPNPTEVERKRGAALP